ncbi:MAG: tetratricopeptide repeat protein, partial [Pseudomonadota bacterium]
MKQLDDTALQKEFAKAAKLALAGDMEASRALCEDLLIHHPDAPELHDLLGVYYVTKRDIARAMPHLDHAIAKRPNSAQYLGHRASAYLELHDYDKALDDLERALRAKPHDASAITNMLLTLNEMNRPNDALQVLHNAEKIGVRDLDVRTLGVTFKQAGFLNKAKKLYRQALQKNPANDGILWNLSHILLLQEQFFDGWLAFEKRWGSPQFVDRVLQLPSRPWYGENLAGQKLLVYFEQGIGDQIMFLSCLPGLLQRIDCNQAQIFIVCDKRLIPLLAERFQEASIIAAQEGIEQDLVQTHAIAWHVAMGTLPRICNLFVHTRIPLPALLTPAHEAVTRIRKELQEQFPGQKLIGISWGSLLPHSGARNLALADFSPLLCQGNVTCIALQYGSNNHQLAEYYRKSGHRIHKIAHVELTTDIDKIIPLVAALDAVVTAANTTVHLAGCIGKPCHVITSMVPSWRWGISDDNHCGWYGSVRLHRRHKDDESWENAMGSAIKSLE